MTTSPKRIDKIYKVIEALEKQTIRPDLYFINLPIVFKRDGTRFSQIPSFLISDRIHLNFCEDLGPATKIVPTCKSEHITEDDIIFSVDDDIYYPPTIIQLYLKYHLKFPNFVLTGTSPFIINGRRRYDLYECELLEGYSCVLYKKEFLEDIPLILFDKQLVPIYHYLSDDLVLSNFLLMKGIGILCFSREKSEIRRIKPLDYGLQADALHMGAGGLASTCDNDENCNFTNYFKTIKYMKTKNEYYLTTTESKLRHI